MDKRVFIIFMISLFFVNGVSTLNITADSCSQEHVQSVVDQVQNAGGGIVYIPAGDCTWTNDVDIEGLVSVIGTGIDQTIIRGNITQLFEHNEAVGESDNYVEYAHMTIYGRQSGGSNSAIKFYNVNYFRIHNIKFAESQWHSVITGRRVFQGLIDNCTFNRNDLGSSDYGISFAGINWINPPSCGLNYTQNCLNDWDDWYKKVGDYTGNEGSCYGDPYDSNWKPGLVDALYIEDNTFNWKGSAIAMNWGSCSKTVWRYNVFNNRNPDSGGIKPGAVFAIFHNNIFNNTNTEDNTPPNGGLLIRLRADTLFYNNEIVGYGGPNSGSHLFAFVAYGCSYGYCYPDDVVPNEIYIWNNTYINCASTCEDSNTGCWAEYSEGEPDRIAINENYFFRAPQSGERLWSHMQNPETPNEYTYPHPLRNEDSIQTCNHPADTSPNNCVIDIDELTAYVNQWKSDLSISINSVMDAISKWKAGSY